MTIKRFAGDKFTGLAADIKPTNVLSGATFHEIDTGKNFVFSDLGAWISPPDSPTTLASQDDVSFGTLVDGNLLRYNLAAGEWQNTLPTGADANVVTGTKGLTNRLVMWNADGDAVDSGKSASDFLESVSFTDINGAAVLLDTETFVASDTTLMTSAAINTQITNKGYLTDPNNQNLSWDPLTGILSISDGANADLDGRYLLSDDFTVNLAVTTSATTATVTNTAGSNAIIPAATTTKAGVMSAADKVKLNGVATNANNYVHPSHAADTINVDTGLLTGATVISDLDFNVTVDSQGHVTDANGVFATRILTLADLGYTGASNAEVNQNAFSNVTAGGNTLAADSKTDTLNLVGANGVSLTSNVTTDTVTIDGSNFALLTDLNSYILTTQKGVANGVAPLDTNGLIPVGHMPALSLTDVNVVADNTARNALTVQEGDVAIVTDATTGANADPTVTSGGASYVYDGTAWQKFKTPDDSFLTVGGATGDIQFNSGSSTLSGNSSFHWDNTNSHLEVTGGVKVKEGGAVATPAQDEALSYIETEVIGTDTITRVMQRLGNGDDVIVASYVQ